MDDDIEREMTSSLCLFTFKQWEEIRRLMRCAWLDGHANAFVEGLKEDA
jgi:hypothetical protein